LTFEERGAIIQAVTSRRHLCSSADARFVLAYHYITCGHTAAAANQLQKVVTANSKDQVAAQLLQMVAGPEGLPGAAPAPPPVPTFEREVPEIPVAGLAGTWTAVRADDAQFELELTADGDFKWTYSTGGKQTVVEGVYVLEGPTSSSSRTSEASCWPRLRRRRTAPSNASVER
jgi:hypothetical protein